VKLGLKIKVPILWCSLAYLFAVITHFSLNKYGTTTPNAPCFIVWKYPTDRLLITTLATSKLFYYFFFRNFEIFREKKIDIFLHNKYSVKENI